MARFGREFFPNNGGSDEAWAKVTDALKSGYRSVEILSRVVDGEDVWEIRSWDSIRTDRSNSAPASPNTDY